MERSRSPDWLARELRLARALLAAGCCALAGGAWAEGAQAGDPPPAQAASEDAAEGVASAGSGEPAAEAVQDALAQAADTQQTQRGLASWYGSRFHGRPTSSGEPFDMHAMTAAHPSWPLPSYARVKHVASGREVVVRVNDRGPFHGDRIIDLSHAAAARLGFVRRGSAVVEIERLSGPPAGAASVAPVRPQQQQQQRMTRPRERR